MSLRVELLGGFKVAAGDTVLDELANQPVRAGLLAYLAVRRQATREEIIGLLWPERSPTRARHALSQTLHRLRQVVGHDIVATDGDRLALSPDVTIDVSDFEERLAAEDLTGALALYKGHLLERFYAGASAAFEHWVDQERARLERVHRTARRDRLNQCRAAGDVTAAQCVAQEWVELDPLEDEAQHALIELLAEASGRAAALRQYEVYARLLADEDLTPLPETEALAQRIRDGETATIRTATPPPAVAEPLVLVDQAPWDPAEGAGPATRSVPRPRRSRLLRVEISVALLVMAALGLLALGPGSGWSAGADPAGGRVLLADFTVEGADSTLAAVVTEALRIDLEQSLGPALLCDRETRAALERMSREAETPIQGDLARELAVREGADYILAGQVAGVAGGYILSGRVLRSSDGVVVGSLREVAEDEGDVIDTIERLSRGLVRLTGRSLQNGGGTPALVQVTTTSLDALRLYTEAVRLADTGADASRALALLDQAVALDSTFAMAHRKIATLLDMSFTGRVRRVQALEKAYHHRERLPRSERGLVEGAYHEQVTGDLDAAVRAYQATLEIEAGNITALDNLAALYIRERRYAEADGLLDRCTMAPIPIASCYYRRLRVVYALEGEEAARQAVHEADALFPASVMIAFQRVWLEGAAGHYERADSLLAALQARMGGSARALAVFQSVAADLDAVRGRFRDAQAHLEDAMQAAEADGLGDTYHQLGLMTAWYALEGARDTARAIDVVDQLVDHPLVRGLDPLDQPYGAFAELYARAGHPDRARAQLQRFEAEVPRPQQALAEDRLELVRALIALSEGRLDEAEAGLTSADRELESPLAVLPHMARIHELRGDSDAALAAYRSYLETRDVGRLAFDALHLGQVLGRVEALETELGGGSAAAGAQRRLAELWAQADPEVRSRIRSPSPSSGLGATGVL